MEAIEGNQRSSSLDAENAGTTPPLRTAHVPAVLRSLSESSESISLPSAETYLSMFVSSKQAQLTSSIPKHACNVLSLGLLLMKLTGKYSSLSWLIVISPLFISNLITFCEKLSEVHYLLVAQSNEEEFSLRRAFRPLGAMIDLVASIYIKVVLCVYLSYGFSITTNEVSLLIPLWLSVALSVTMRFTAKDVTTNQTQQNNHSTSFYRSRLLMIFAFTFLFLQRVAQPLLLVLKLSGHLSTRTHWSIVFAPSWVTLFFVLACALLLVSFAPLISSHGNTVLRDTTKILIYLLAFRFAVGAICAIIFLILLSEKLDYESSNHLHGNDVSINKILLPLIVLFLFMILLQPIVMKVTNKYQEVLAALILQRQNRPGMTSSAASPQLIVEKHKRELYFLQISPTLYANCDAQGNAITSVPHKSLPQQVKELFRAFFPLKKKSKRLAGNSDNQNTYSEVNQSQHSNQSIELSTFSSQTSSVVDDSHDRYLEEGGKEDEDEESVIVFNSRELETEIKMLQNEDTSDEAPSPRTNAPNSAPNLFTHTQCVVCLNHTANAIIYDCGHAVTCLACGISIAKKPPSHCPICRATITRLLEMSTKPFPLDSRKVMTISRVGYTFHVNDPLAAHPNHHPSLHATPHRQLLPTNRHMITNTISNLAAHHHQSIHSNQDSLIDILMN